MGHLSRIEKVLAVLFIVIWVTLLGMTAWSIIFA